MTKGIAKATCGDARRTRNTAHKTENTTKAVISTLARPQSLPQLTIDHVEPQHRNRAINKIDVLAEAVHDLATFCGSHKRQCGTDCINKLRRKRTQDQISHTALTHPVASCGRRDSISESYARSST